MRTEILIVSYLKDKPWLHYCLRSIKKFAVGFSGTTIVVPRDEAGAFMGMADGFGFRLCEYERDQDEAKWQIHAQAMKCSADVFCPSADYVLHTDSDCVFTELVSPADYLDGGKPVMLYESFSRLKDNPWKAVVSRVLNRPVEFEFMRRHPQVNPIGLYYDFREEIERIYGVPFVEFVLAQKSDFPWGFTEHVCMGAFAFYSSKWHDEYRWVNLAREARPKDKLMQFWSHADIHEMQDLPSGGKGRPTQVFSQLGL